MAERTETAELERPGVPSSEDRLHAAPKLIIPFGRGKTGKTTFSRWCIERALNAGRPVVVADADPNNQSLAGFFPKLKTGPESTHDAELRRFLYALFDRQIAERSSVVLDLGADARVLKRAAEELPLVEFLEEQGIVPVAIHMMGPDLDDLAYLADVEDWVDEATGEQTMGSFAPKHTILVVNEGTIRNGMEARMAFAEVRRHAIVEAAIRRGARVVVMPALACMKLLEDRHQGFVSASVGEDVGGKGSLGPSSRWLVKTWWGKMADAFGEVTTWLP